MIAPDAAGGRPASPVRDPVLVRAAQAGDLDAFGELVRRHQRPAYRVALRMLRSESDAEEAAQEAFVQAWRSLHRFRGESAFSTWLYRIVTNRCLSVLQSRRPTTELHREPADHGADPARRAEDRERFGAVVDAIQALPGEQRAALVLRDLEGLSYAEISEVLDVSLPAVKGRIHRARLAVAEEVAPWR